jgi:hypothetical protein
MWKYFFILPIYPIKIKDKLWGIHTLSEVEGEFSSFSKSYVTGCRIKSGMTGRD